MKKFTKEGRFECGLDDIVKGKVWAFTPGNHEPSGVVGLGIAIANEPGYNPVPLHWCHAETYDEMHDHCDELNREEGLTDEMAIKIVSSTMAAQNVKRRTPTPERVSDWFCGMIEGNDMTRAWCHGIYPQKIGEYPKEKELVWYGHPEAFAIPDWEVEVHFDDPGGGEGDGEGRFRLTQAALQRGLEIMREKHGDHYFDLMHENEDAITYDILLQCIVLGEVVYG